jgi:hypothetical protein
MSEANIKRTLQYAKEFFPATDHFEVAHLIRAAIQPLVDKGSSMDSGGGADNADLWFTVGGVEYYANIRRSNTQRARDGH